MQYNHKHFTSLIITLGITVSAYSTPYIIDTDLASDDTMALAYLLQTQPQNILAISIAGTGEVNCQKYGRKNLAKLLKYFHQEHIPYACGPVKPLAGAIKFPQAWRQQANEQFNLNLPDAKIQSKWPLNSAVNLILHTLKKSKKSVTFIELAPNTNLALEIGRAHV